MKRLFLAALLAAPLAAGVGSAHAAGNSNNGQGVGTWSPDASCVGWGASQTATIFGPQAVPKALGSTGIPVAGFIAYLRSLGPNCGLA